MKIVVFGPERRVGALAADIVLDLNKVDEELPAELGAFIEAGDRALERAQRAIDQVRHAADSAVHPVAGVKLHGPWPRHRIAMVGGNYARHSARAAVRTVSPADLVEFTRKMRADGLWGFWKVGEWVTGPEEDLPYPKRARYLDYEAEVAIVIGKRAKDIPASRVEEMVWGVTLMNDWSIRYGDGAPRNFNWNLRKNWDGAAGLGPAIVVGEIDPMEVDVETKVNGELRQRFNSSEMVFSFGETLEFLSRDFTFVPGDIIGSGTQEGTAVDSTPVRPGEDPPTDRFLKIGDVVEIHSPQVGMLRNRIVAG